MVQKFCLSEGKLWNGRCHTMMESTDGIVIGFQILPYSEEDSYISMQNNIVFDIILHAPRAARRPKGNGSTKNAKGARRFPSA